MTLSRPEAHNAIDPETAIALLKAWKDYRDDKNCLCAILTGAGEHSFCTGLDLSTTIPILTNARPPKNDEEKILASDPDLVDKATLRNFELYKPVISAVNGFAIAAGMEILQATDIRIASENAKFGLQEAKWGLFPMGGATVRLPRSIPSAVAMELLLTGDLIDAHRAHDVGLVNRIVPQSEVAGVAVEYARAVAENGPLAVQAIRRSAREGIGLPEAEALDQEREIGLPVFATDDAREGPRAFIEKRAPKFTGQ